MNRMQVVSKQLDHFVEHLGDYPKRMIVELMQEASKLLWEAGAKSAFESSEIKNGQMAGEI